MHADALRPIPPVGAGLGSITARRPDGIPAGRLVDLSRSRCFGAVQPKRFTTPLRRTSMPRPCGPVHVTIARVQTVQLAMSESCKRSLVDERVVNRSWFTRSNDRYSPNG